jgi:hypothetical protein
MRLRRHPGDVSAAIDQTLLPLVAETYMSGAGAVRAGMITQANITLPPIHSIDAVRYLRNMPAVFDQVGVDLWGAVTTELADGFVAGESIPELAARVRSAAGTTSRTATLVARSVWLGRPMPVATTRRS